MGSLPLFHMGCGNFNNEDASGEARLLGRTWACECTRSCVFICERAEVRGGGKQPRVAHRRRRPWNRRGEGEPARMLEREQRKAAEVRFTAVLGDEGSCSGRKGDINEIKPQNSVVLLPAILSSPI